MANENVKTLVITLSLTIYNKFYSIKDLESLLETFNSVHENEMEVSIVKGGE